MPFFSNKFSPKKPPERKNLLQIKTDEPLEDLTCENHKIKLKLGTQECVFENGQWNTVNGVQGNIRKINKRQENKIEELQEENNMLKIKYEILLNMLTQTTAESHVQQRELEKLRKLNLK